MRWAVAEGHRKDNPDGEAIGAALPTNGVQPQHLGALPYAEVAGATERVSHSGAYPATVLAFAKMVRDLGIRAVPHGFRSSFRDWAAECTDAPREVCELALAHVTKNATGVPTCSSGDANSWSSGRFS